MADRDHVEWLKSGHKAWNDRRILVDFKPDLAYLDFHDVIPNRISRNNRHGFFNSFNFSKANLQGTKLSGLGFSNVKFSKANLEGADLENGTFRNAKFDQANLSNVNAASADFENAVFRGANLEGTVLQGADLRRVDLTGAIISDHQFESALQIGEAFEHARISASRKPPEDWSSVASGTKSSFLKKDNRGRYLVLYGTNRKPILHNGVRLRAPALHTSTHPQASLTCVACRTLRIAAAVIAGFNNCCDPSEPYSKFEFLCGRHQTSGRAPSHIFGLSAEADLNSLRPSAVAKASVLEEMSGIYANMRHNLCAYRVHDYGRPA